MKTDKNNSVPAVAAANHGLAISASARWLFFVLLAFGLFLWSANQAKAHEDPPGCNPPTGAGNVSICSLYSVCHDAHVGDTIPFAAGLGMMAGACRATDATGTIYFPDGTSTNFLMGAILDPGVLFSCPGNPRCQPGLFTYTIKAQDVGAPGVSPLCTFPGVPNLVQVVANSSGITHKNDFDGSVSFRDCRNEVLLIVNPCIDVTKECLYPQGQSCFDYGQDIVFRGTVRNCGDIPLTNVTVIDNIVGPLTLMDGNGIPLTLPVRLNAGATAFFVGSHPASGNLLGPFTNIVNARGVDVSACGGPRSIVTDSVTNVCVVCPSPSLSVVRSGSNAVISWPSVDSTGFLLEQASTLAPPPNWTTNTTSINDNGSNKSVTLPATNSARFFRLRKP